MKKLKILLIKLKNFLNTIFSGNDVNVTKSETFTNIKKISFGYTDNEINISFFIFENLNKQSNLPIISKKELIKLNNKINKIKNINEVIIYPIIKIFDNPTLKIIRMTIKL